MLVNRIVNYPRKYSTSILSNRRELAEMDIAFVNALKREEVPWTAELLKIAHDARRILAAGHQSP